MKLLKRLYLFFKSLIYPEVPQDIAPVEIKRQVSIEEAIEKYFGTLMKTVLAVLLVVCVTAAALGAWNQIGVNVLIDAFSAFIIAIILGMI